MANDSTLQQDEQFLEYVRLSDAYKQAAEAELGALRAKLAAHEAAVKKAQALVPDTLKEMLKHARITEDFKKRAEELLLDPVECVFNAMTALKEAADPDKTVRPRRMGQPEGGPTKSGAARGSGTIAEQLSRSHELASAAYDQNFYSEE